MSAIQRGGISAIRMIRNDAVEAWNRRVEEAEQNENHK